MLSAKNFYKRHLYIISSETIKNLYLIGILIALPFGLIAQQKPTLTITNPSHTERNELISIPYEQFNRHMQLRDTLFSIINENSNQPLVYQFEKRGTATIKNILIAINLKAKEQVKLSISPEKTTAAKPQTFARHVPERKDDFAWENNVVAFRAYGKALEGTSEDAQGFDYWAKRTDQLIMDQWYIKGDYHRDHGQGLDYYAVGQTVGLGDIAFLYEDKILFSKHYRSFEILDNGPLRSTFKLIFPEQQINGQSISIEKIISIDAESQLFKVTCHIINKNNKNTNVLIGLANRQEQNPQISQDPNYFAYWEPEVKGNSTGAGLIFPHLKKTFVPDKKQFLWKINVINDKTFTYYAGAAFNKAGKITNLEQWTAYLMQKTNELKQPIRINYSK